MNQQHTASAKVDDFALGEAAGPGSFTDMEWVDFEVASDRINTAFFLARFSESAGDTIAYCTMTEDGDVFALCDLSGEEKPLVPDWRLVSDPVEVLVPKEPLTFDIVAHLARQRAFSEKTFGPGARTKGVIDHIRKELAEIEADPTDLAEWVDVIILAFDGAWRAGWEPDAIIKAIVAKQAKNEARTWPDWRTADPEKAIEHDRTGEKPNRADANPAAVWCFDMALAPHNARILVLSDPVGEVYAAHWVQHPVTGDEAWLISETSDGSQHLCKPKAWALIPTSLEVAHG